MRINVFIKRNYSITGLFITAALTQPLFSVERPMIWLTPAEKPIIEKNIKHYPWAAKRYAQLQQRADTYAPTTIAQRIENIRRLPLKWNETQGSFPAFIDQANIGVNPLRHPLQISLQAAIDCSILFNFTQKQSYADCATDILYTVIQGLNSTPISTEPVHLNNRGWIVSKNHLLESRIYSAQIPIIYDFMYNYLKKGGKAYDIIQKKHVPFDFEAAQNVFKANAQLALDSGIINNNWPVLESTSLVHNALAIDDKEIRQHYLNHYLNLNTPHQDSLAKIAKNYVNKGDIWPESLNYSIHVAYFSLYLMTLLDRINPQLQLGNTYPNIATALLTIEQLRFPNKAFPAFGDGARFFKDNYFEYELAYKSAMLNNNNALIHTFSNELKQAIKTGRYNRSKLLPQHTSAKPYYAPLELLWAVGDLGKQKSTATFDAHTTVDIPFAGLFIQRNINTRDPVKNGLMATTGGGSYVHGHASGIDLELYGQGHVLGVEAGKGAYPTDVHQNYKRLFAGHNTVISNGASASKGGWIQLGIHRVQKTFIEPEPRTPAISDAYSFVTTDFYDEHNLVKEAYHQRTTAVIRLSDNHGYYLDIFRAKSDNNNQFHDYLYRNLSDTLDIYSQDKQLKLQPTPNRYPKAIDAKWSHDRNFAHPGWHFLTNIHTSKKTNKGIVANFTANAYKNSPITMQSRIIEGLDVSISQATAPKTKIEPEPYKHKTIPMFLLRHQGDTWSNPFALTYESFSNGEKPALTSTHRLMHNGLFKGVKITASINKKTITQFVLIQEGNQTTYNNTEYNFSFSGHFAVITLADSVLQDLYIGEGKTLRFQNTRLTVPTDNHSAYFKAQR